MSTIKIMLIRHAEKPTDGINGVSVEGDQNPEELTVQGWQRAGALIGLFSPTPTTAMRAGIETPNALYASGSASLRPSHTLLPLESKLGEKLDVSTKKNDTTELVDEITSVGGVVLVAWQHQDIPGIAKAIVNGSVAIPSPWPDDRFDLVWVFDRPSGEGDWTFSQIPQLLLAGDKSTVIPLT